MLEGAVVSQAGNVAARGVGLGAHGCAAAVPRVATSRALTLKSRSLSSLVKWSLDSASRRSAPACTKAPPAGRYPTSQISTNEHHPASLRAVVNCVLYRLGFLILQPHECGNFPMGNDRSKNEKTIWPPFSRTRLFESSSHSTFSFAREVYEWRHSQFCKIVSICAVKGKNNMYPKNCL